jgi:hypothetical protein
MLRVGRKIFIFKRRPTFIKNLTLQRDSRNIIRVKERENISPPINIIIVIRWDTLVRTVFPEREEYKRRNKKRHHAHVAEDDEPPKKLTKEKIEYYVLFSSISGSVTPGEDTWLIDSSASKHMTGQKYILSSLIENDFPHKVSLGADYKYPIKGMGESTYKLDS